MIDLISSDALPDLISVSVYIEHHFRMPTCNRNCTSRKNTFHHARTTWLVFELEPLNAFDNIEPMIALSFEEDPLEVYWWEQSTLPSVWNLYGPEESREGRGLDINDPVFGRHWTRYSWAYILFPCDLQEPCDCKWHEWAGALSTIGRAAAAATTAKLIGILLVVVVPPMPNRFEIVVYSWHS